MPSIVSNSKPAHKWQFDAIGTRWSIETERPLGDVQNRLAERIDAFDRTYSRFRDDSLVTKVAASPGVYHFPADAEDLIAAYRYLYDLTDGAVSPLIGGTLESAGYDKEYSLHAATIRDVPEWDDVMVWHGAVVTVKQAVLLDFGAVGKGYLIDLLAELLERNGHGRYIIDASGDIRMAGYEQTIGLENPYDPSEVIGSAVIKSGSLCASATNRRAWGEWHHVVDARSARPTRDVVATWVTAPLARDADGLATALFFLPKKSWQQQAAEYVRLFADGTIERSAGFVGELYI